jgi:hypothetical protein
MARSKSSQDRYKIVLQIHTIGGGRASSIDETRAFAGEQDGMNATSTVTFLPPIMPFAFTAELRAASLRAGRPNADATALDIDVPLAAQALSFGGTPVVVTTNPRHI